MIEYIHEDDSEAIAYVNRYMRAGLSSSKLYGTWRWVAELDYQLFKITLSLTGKDLDAARGPEYWKQIDSINFTIGEMLKNGEPFDPKEYEATKKTILLNMLKAYKRSKHEPH